MKKWTIKELKNSQYVKFSKEVMGSNYMVTTHFYNPKTEQDALGTSWWCTTERMAENNALKILKERLNNNEKN